VPTHNSAARPTLKTTRNRRNGLGAPAYFAQKRRSQVDFSRIKTGRRAPQFCVVAHFWHGFGTCSHGRSLGDSAAGLLCKHQSNDVVAGKHKLIMNREWWPSPLGSMEAGIFAARTFNPAVVIEQVLGLASSERLSYGVRSAEHDHVGVKGVEQTRLRPRQFIGAPASAAAKINDRIVLPVDKEATDEPVGIR